jgi:hypothetical protein
MKSSCIIFGVFYATYSFSFIGNNRVTRGNLTMSIFDSPSLTFSQLVPQMAGEPQPDEKSGQAVGVSHHTALLVQSLKDDGEAQPKPCLIKKP